MTPPKQSLIPSKRPLWTLRERKHRAFKSLEKLIKEFELIYNLHSSSLRKKDIEFLHKSFEQLLQENSN